jgi:thymidine kinase
MFTPVMWQNGHKPLQTVFICEDIQFTHNTIKDHLQGLSEGHKQKVRIHIMHKKFEFETFETEDAAKDWIKKSKKRKYVCSYSEYWKCWIVSF